MAVLWTILLAAAAAQMCDICHTAVKAANDGLVDVAYPLIEDLAVRLCAKRYPPEACSTGARGLITIFLDSLAEKYLDSAYVCASLSLCSSPSYSVQNFSQWLSDLNGSQSDLYVPLPTADSLMTIGHITDPHVDFYYKPGTNAQCGETICCQERFGEGSAGLWGDFRCDLPLWTFEEAVKSLSEHPLDFVIYTGDSASHDIMNQTEGLKLESIETLSAVFSQYITVPVYPILGNNDGAPSEEFDFRDSAWLLDPISAYFTSWLSPSALSSFRATGSYSQLHLNTSLRIVAINTQACKNLNFYLIANVTDPGAQIQFLYEQLLLAEGNSERVYILGHIPPGSSDCLSAWAQHYNALIARFSHVIAGQFFGHTHSDQFIVSNDPLTGLPATVQWVSPSVTTLSNRNPSYRVYTANSGNYALQDFTQYRLDLEAANSLNATLWTPVYSFRETYGVSDLSLESLTGLVEALRINSSLAVTYLRNYNTDGPDSPTECDSDCLFSLNCQLTNAVYKDVLTCGNQTESQELKALEMLQGPWTYLT